MELVASLVFLTTLKVGNVIVTSVISGETPNTHLAKRARDLALSFDCECVAYGSQVDHSVQVADDHHNWGTLRVTRIANRD